MSCSCSIDCKYKLKIPLEFRGSSVGLFSAKMATVAESRMNLAALQRRDPYITSIVDQASQVAIYSFSAETNEWVSEVSYFKFNEI